MYKATFVPMENASFL